MGRWGVLLTQLLQLKPVTLTSPVIHAGADRLDVPVTWVHISEMERAAQLFRGGELLLTQGRGIPHTRVGQRSWIHSLADAGVAGVAIETGHVFDEIPAGIILGAQESGLPLIELPRPAYFMEITRAVHASIIQNEHDTLLHSTELARRMARLVLAGGALQEVMDEIASAVGRPVALTGGTHSLRAFAPRQNLAQFETGNWRSHTSADHDMSSPGTVSMSTGGATACFYVPIRVHGESWGCLHMLSNESAPHQSRTRSLEFAAALLGIAYGPRENLHLTGNDMWSEILQDVLTTSSHDGLDVGGRLQWGGLNPDEPLRVLMAEPIETSDSGVRPVQGHRRTEALLALNHHLQSVISDRAIIGHFSNRVAAIVSGDCDLRSLEHITSPDGNGAVVGASGLTDVQSLIRASRHAAEAVEYALETGVDRGLYNADHLFLERLLLRMNEDGTLRETVEHELGAILDQQPRTAAALIATLVAYFEHGGSKARIARALGVDRRTVRARIEKINRLVGNNFEHPDKQLSLRLAIRGNALLGGQ